MAARLRKAFKYPDDNEGNDREELDEEEQEQLIGHLRVQNDQYDSQYTIIFAVIPLLSAAAVFVPPMISRNAGLQERFMSFLSTLSLIATAYLMKYIPLRHPDPKGKKPMRNPDLPSRIRQFLLPVNTASCGLLLLMYILSPPTAPPFSSNSSLTYLIPGVMLTAIVIVREVMVSVDLKPLENLRYEYKGA
ncbi:hypothetical protein FE257_003153 [Aspergillus nanangensis]|uniref:Uncharacterized protein n=1 Tax=Aspergillus nanangensis TaxID=2582783 RepID=A0AAD4GNP4_ASPNN|nr:hypothetical protein FE257_003153 [Aspergillus nanangensis]